MIPFIIYLLACAFVTWAIIAYINKFHIPRLYKIVREDSSVNVKLLKRFFLAMASLLFLTFTIVVWGYVFIVLDLKVSFYWFGVPYAVVLLHGLIFNSKQIAEIIEIIDGEKK